MKEGSPERLAENIGVGWDVNDNEIKMWGKEKGESDKQNKEKEDIYVNKTKTSGHSARFISSTVTGQPESCHCSSSYSSAD